MTDDSAFCLSADRAISYRPLSASRNEIRILVLEPPSPVDNRIRCRLEHDSLYNLDNDFVALSYYWGDHNALKRIVLSENLVPITFNLYRALEELRRRGHYRVWADDLCINRNDDEERSQQVLRIGAIYRAASLVISHLRGPGQAWQQALAEAVHRITRRADVPKRDGKDRAQARKDDQRIRKLTRDGSIGGEMKQRRRNTYYGETARRLVVRRSVMELSAAEETALFLFLDNPYWRRVWIIQEISMNPRLTIIWGRQAFELSQLLQAFSCLGNYIRGKREKVWNHIKCVYKIRRSQLALRPLSLIEALGLCYLAKAQFLRDHVFALLGLTHDGAYLVPFPSYTLPLEDISRDMTIRLIRATGNLDVVISKEHGIETWYPDWFSSRWWHWYRVSHHRLGRPSLLTHTNYGPYRASGNQMPFIKLYEHGISAKGFFLGTIADCSPTLDEVKDSGLPRAELLRPRSWRRNSRNERLFFGSEPAETMRTLCWLLIDITRSSTLSTKRRRPGTHLYTLLHTLLHRKETILEQAPSLLQWLNCCEARGFKINDKRLVTYFSMKSNVPLSPGDRETLEEDCRTIQKNLRANMRLGCTEEGGIGWFGSDTRIDDRVAILLGASMPCVLRQRPAGGYTIVGSCILDGVMKGEAVRKGMHHAEDIHLH
ncbi:hypothetical protein NPX13_g3562 [Xylaria arbuscula]|uniref:Heterokaryon incompatibility domain-containing protein n=1 Tax=Xylaria arbuscula TaxID=114810 RepID=A0A9W8NH34_9PEZI|nr:hypothetical protein NPX13_g3562 [Xylaria arbuscula]